jgi:hypothetical protein
MVGSKTGLVGHLKQLRVKYAFLLCIIQQEALFSNIMKRISPWKWPLILSVLFAGKKLKDTKDLLHFF